MARNVGRTLAAAAGLAAARQFGGQAAKAATTIATGWRKYSKRKNSNVKQRVQMRPSTLLVKMRRFNEVFASKDSRTLYTYPLSQITQGNARNERERQIIRIRGVKINYNFSVDSGTNQPVYCRWVVASMRYWDSDTAPSGGDFGRDFFLGQITRGEGFSALVGGPEFYARPVNPDKWHVHQQGKFILAPAVVSNSNVGTGNSYAVIDKYIPVNQTISYDGLSSTDCKNPLYFMYWFATFNQTIVVAPGLVDVAGTVETHYQD